MGRKSHYTKWAEEEGGAEGKTAIETEDEGTEEHFREREIISTSKHKET